MPPRRIAAPVPFEFARVSLPMTDGPVSFLVFAPQHTYADPDQLDGLAGERTAPAFPLDESAKYFLVLVALCEPRLRDSTTVALPSADEIAERLQPDERFRDLTRAAVNHHIDYLAITKLRVKEPRPGADERLECKREALVSIALRFGLVRDEHRRLLPPVRSRWTGSVAPGPVVEVPAGYRVGRWEVLSHIASGSWASVYAARRVQRPRGPHDPPEGARGALKFLPSASLSPAQSADIAKVSEEVRFNEQTDHPRLIRTFETLVVDDPREPALDGAVVLAMERAAVSLQDLLAARTPPEPIADAARILREICEALVHIHALGWVHGDLKPSNVLLMEDGTARVADFGLARELDGTHAYAPRLGTSDFLPPEWWNERIGTQGIAVRPTADIWAFGVTVHQLLTGGMLPFPGLTARARGAAAQAYAQGQAQLRLADGLAPPWRAIIADCLAPDHARGRATRRRRCWRGSTRCGRTVAPFPLPSSTSTASLAGPRGTGAGRAREAPAAAAAAPGGGRAAGPGGDRHRLGTRGGGGGAVTPALAPASAAARRCACSTWRRSVEDRCGLSAGWGSRVIRTRATPRPTSSPGCGTATVSAPIATCRTGRPWAPRTARRAPSGIA